VTGTGAPGPLRDLLARTAGVRLVVLGDAILDHYVVGDAARLSPEAPVPVVRVARDDYRPGGAANTVLNCRALGAAADLVAAVGADAYGEQLLGLLKTAGVGTEGVVVADERPTTRKTRLLVRGQQLARLDREVEGDVGPVTEDRLRAAFEAALARADGVILSDYGKGVVTAGVAAHVISRTLAAGKVVCVDPKENHFDLYAGATSVTPNHHEAAAAAGIREADDPTLERTGSRLRERLGAASVLITCGERGMVLFRPNGVIDRIPTRAREVFDVAGAGDTVVAVFTAALAAGADHLAAAQLANFAASVVVAKVGTATATLEEILAALAAFNATP
jgi:D-beta-D-heptose 7-phosphate kinase/D-beta-D-heptose 1-phosphate adenosyltransferase